MEPAWRRFGFIFANAEIVRETKFVMTGIGQGRFRCEKRVNEKVTLDLGREIILKSGENKYEFVDDKECE